MAEGGIATRPMGQSQCEPAGQCAARAHQCVGKVLHVGQHFIRPRSLEPPNEAAKSSMRGTHFTRPAQGGRRVFPKVERHPL